MNHRRLYTIFRLFFHDNYKKISKMIKVPINLIVRAKKSPAVMARDVSGLDGRLSN